MSHYNTFSNKNKKHIIKRINFSELYTSPYKRRRKSMLTKKWINKKSHHGCPAISNTKNRPLGPYHLWINGTSHLYDWNFWYPQEYGQKCIFLSFGERLYIMIWDAFLSLMVTRLLDTLGWLQEVQFLKLILKEKKKNLLEWLQFLDRITANVAIRANQSYVGIHLSEYVLEELKVWGLHSLTNIPHRINCKSMRKLQASSSIRSVQPPIIITGEAVRFSP